MKNRTAGRRKDSDLTLAEVVGVKPGYSKPVVERLLKLSDEFTWLNSIPAERKQTYLEYASEIDYFFENSIWDIDRYKKFTNKLINSLLSDIVGENELNINQISIVLNIDLTYLAYHSRVTMLPKLNNIRVFKILLELAEMDGLRFDRVKNRYERSHNRSRFSSNLFAVEKRCSYPSLQQINQQLGYTPAT